MIPEGGGTDLFCQYFDSLGIPRVVNWYRRSSIIINRNLQEKCDCVSVPSSSGHSTNLTFSDFTVSGTGRYGCWAAIPDGFDECDFYVVIGKGSTTSKGVGRGSLTAPIFSPTPKSD